jgi:hypothetical protein
MKVKNFTTLETARYKYEKHFGFSLTILSLQGAKGSISTGIAILISTVPIKDIFLFVSIQSFIDEYKDFIAFFDFFYSKFG